VAAADGRPRFGFRIPDPDADADLQQLGVRLGGGGGGGGGSGGGGPVQFSVDGSHMGRAKVGGAPGPQAQEHQ
jgi:hypothetical protein